MEHLLHRLYGVDAPVRGEGLVWLIGGGMSVCCTAGRTVRIEHVMDGHIMCCGFISSNQSSATCQIVKRDLTKPLPLGLPLRLFVRLQIKHLQFLSRQFTTFNIDFYSAKVYGPLYIQIFWLCVEIGLHSL